MERLTKRQLQLLIVLSDEKGYSQTGLAEIIRMKPPNLSKMLQGLEAGGIVYREPERKKKEERGEGGPGLYYHIGPKETVSPPEKLNIFQLILKSSLVELESDLQKRLLSSKYVNSLIATCGLKLIYEKIEDYLEREEFRRNASQTLLHQQALIDEYINLPSLMKEYMEANRGIDLLKYMDEMKYLKFLFGLDYIEAIKFYRKFLCEPFGKLYRDLTDRDVPRTEDVFVTEGIRKFLELDLYLSPMTSFPMNYPVELLFERPFERLYTDFYICDEKDIKKLILRAHTVYSNLIDVVSAGVVNSGIYVSDLEALLKQYIFYWNIASGSLDSLYKELKKLNIFSDNCNFSESLYHIYSDIIGLQIKDLASGNLLLDRDTRSCMNYNSLMLDLDDPTRKIRICGCFEEEGLETEEALYENVLPGIKLKLKNEIWDEGDGRLSYGGVFGR